MKKEIGSEFWDIPLQEGDNQLFDERYRWFISGRAALDHILKDIKTKHDASAGLLPSWCCESMIEPFIRNDIQVSFYSVGIENDVLVKKINGKADILLDMDYFGYSNDNKTDFNGIVINDITHSVFTRDDHQGDYLIGSLRKWAGFKTGGFAFCGGGFKIDEPKKTDNDYILKRQVAMARKKEFIENDIGDKSFLDVYREAEEMLENLYDLSAAEDDIHAAHHLNVDYIKNRRIENAQKLLVDLKEYAIFKEVKSEDCPLFVPIIVPEGKRDELRRRLISHDIYCPVHWPISSYLHLNEEERFLYDNELSIVCDQRYSLAEMERVSKLIKDYLC